MLNRATNTKVDIDIDCLSVFTNPMMGGGISKNAILSGVVSKSTSPYFLVEDQVAFMVSDNGEGQNAPPDQFTPFNQGGTCGGGMIGGDILTSERGNVVVTAN